MNKKRIILIMVMTAIISGIVTSMPPPTITSSWQVTETTDYDYFTYFQDSTSKNTYTCLLSKTATKMNEISAHKPIYNSNNEQIGQLNAQPYTLPNGTRYFGWCRNIDANTLPYLKFGEASTTIEYLETYQYPTSEFEYDGFTAKFYCNNIFLEYPITSITSNEPIGIGVKWSLDVPDGYVCNGTFRAEQNILEREDCSGGFFDGECKTYFISYDDFEANNQIDSYNETPIYNVNTTAWEDFKTIFFKIFGYDAEDKREIIGYSKEWTGYFTDFDPSLSYTIASSSSPEILFTNRTEPSNYGLRLETASFMAKFDEYMPANLSLGYGDSSLNNLFTTNELVNLIGNYNMETTSSWIALDTPASQGRSSERAYLGTYSWRVNNTEVSYEGAQQQNVPVTAGLTYNLSGYIYVESGVGCLISARKGSDGSYVSSTNGATTASWTYVAGSFTVPAGETTARIYLNANNGATVCYFDNVRLTLEYLPAYNATGGIDGTGAYLFDGSNDYISFPDTSATDFDKEMTMMAWVKPRATLPTWSYVISKDNAAAPRGYYLGFNSTMLRWRIDGLTTYADYAYTLPLNDWTHLAVAYNGINATLYINGTAAATTAVTGTITNSDDPVRFGDRITAGTNNYYSGLIDDVRLFDKGLSAEQIKAIYLRNTSSDDYIDVYAKSGNFESMVFSNTNEAQYWNLTMSMAANNTDGINLSDTNLVAYWALDNNAADAKGVNNGTILGANNATGISSQAIDFIDNSYIQINNGFDYSTGAVAFWMQNRQSATSNTMGIFTKVGNPAYSSDTAYAFLGTTVSNSAYLQLSIRNNNNEVYAWKYNNINLLNKGWHHIVIQANASGNSLYIDGANVNPTYSVGNNLNTEWLNYPSGNTGFYLGSLVTLGTPSSFLKNSSLDEFAIYNKSLSTTEIQLLYKAGLSQRASTNITLQTRTANNYNVSDPNLIAFFPANTANQTLISASNATYVGSWTTFYDAAVAGTQYRRATSAVPTSAYALYNLTVPITGEYSMYHSYVSNTIYNPSVPHVIDTDDGTFSISVDQKNMLAYSWKYVGIFNFTQGNYYKLNITNNGSGYTLAGTILLRKQGDQTMTIINEAPNARFNGSVDYNAVSIDGKEAQFTTDVGGVVGSGIYFPGNTSGAGRINLTYNFSKSPELAICSWVYPTYYTAYSGIFTTRNGAGTLTGLTTGSDGRMPQFGINNIWAYGKTNMSRNNWYHTCGVWNGTHAMIYSNGNLENTAAASGPIQQAALNTAAIGTDIGFGRNWLGMMDEIRIYNRSLSGEEVQNIYEFGSYHINDWTAWSSAQYAKDNTPITVASQSKFYQFRANMISNSTDVSPYIINYTVANGSATVQDTTKPYFNYVPENQTIEYLYNLSVSFGGNDTEHQPVTWNINYTEYFLISANGTVNSTGIIPVGFYPINVSITDTAGNENSTLFTVNVTKSHSTIFLYLNSTRNNLLMSKAGKVDINASVIYGDQSSITITRDGLPMLYATNPAYLGYFAEKVGSHIIQASILESSNYMAASESWILNYSENNMLEDCSTGNNEDELRNSSNNGIIYCLRNNTNVFVVQGRWFSNGTCIKTENESVGC